MTTTKERKDKERRDRAEKFMQAMMIGLVSGDGTEGERVDKIRQATRLSIIAADMLRMELELVENHEP